MVRMVMDHLLPKALQENVARIRCAELEGREKTKGSYSMEETNL